jgi:hypothetical protein
VVEDNVGLVGEHLANRFTDNRLVVYEQDKQLALAVLTTVLCRFHTGRPFRDIGETTINDKTTHSLLTSWWFRVQQESVWRALSERPVMYDVRTNCPRGLHRPLTPAGRQERAT